MILAPLRVSRGRRVAAGLLLFASAAVAAPERGARVVILPPSFVALAISPDGSTVVGTDGEVGGPATWRRGWIRPLGWKSDAPGMGFPIAASARARVVADVGFGDVSVWQRGQLRVLAVDGEARDVSADGRVVVGFVDGPSGSRVGLRWVDGVPQPLAADAFEARWPLAVSADGRSVAGEGSFDGGPPERFLWRDGEATRVPGLPHATGNALVELPSFGLSSLLLSADGSTLVHFDLVGDPACGSACGPAVEAWRWRDGATESLGFLDPGDELVTPFGVTTGGDVIVGGTFGPSGQTAFLWDATHGMRSLAELVESLGGDLQGFALGAAYGISDDGRTIVGPASDPAAPFASRSYLVMLPPACADDVDNDGDGAVDSPADADCRSAASGGEARAVLWRDRPDGS